MTIFDVILRLIKELMLIPSDKQQQLAIDSEEYEKTCTTDSKDPIKRLLAQLNKEFLVRMIMPFVYFFALKYVRDMMSDDKPDEIFD